MPKIKTVSLEDGRGNRIVAAMFPVTYQGGFRGLELVRPDDGMPVMTMTTAGHIPLKPDEVHLRDFGQYRGIYRQLKLKGLVQGGKPALTSNGMDGWKTRLTTKAKRLLDFNCDLVELGQA